VDVSVNVCGAQVLGEVSGGVSVGEVG
jgi:hypothetical protein